MIGPLHNIYSVRGRVDSRRTAGANLLQLLSVEVTPVLLRRIGIQKILIPVLEDSDRVSWAVTHFIRTLMSYVAVDSSKLVVMFRKTLPT